MPQLALNPIDYTSRLTGPDLGQALLAGYQEAEQRKLLQAQMQQQLQAKAQLDAAKQEALRNPSGAAYRRLFLLDPASKDSIKAAHDSLDADTQKQGIADLTAMYGYAKAGRKDDVRRIIQRRIDADKKAGQDTADDEQFLAMVDDEEEAADVVGLLGLQLAGIMGEEKFDQALGALGNETRADAELPSKIAKMDADAALGFAQAGKAKEEAKQIAPNAVSGRAVDAAKVRDLSSQIQWRAESLALDRDKLETSTGLELEKLAQARELSQTSLSPGSEKTMTDAVIAAESNRQLGQRASSLADRVGALGNGGTAAQVQELVKTAFGSPTLLRKEYTALINSQAVKNLPPGPASDRDIQLALKGFPPPNSNAETMASFLRGVAKMQDLAANREQARADWISDNGNLGTAKRDLTVNGVRVPKGSTFSDFSKSQAAIERREDATAGRSYMRFGNGSR